MRARNVGLGLLTMLLVVLAGGCKKSAVNQQPDTTVARVHWLGLEQLARETNTANFLSILNLPGSKQLAAQTLDKLALALTGEPPAARSNRLSETNKQSSGSSNQVTSASNAVPVASLLSTTSSPLASKLRPLLEDLLQAEAYVEFGGPTNQPAELALAIRLAELRAGLWASNLTAVLGAMTNVQALPGPTNGQAWRLPLAPRPSRLDLARAGEWTLLGVGTDTNRLLAELSRHIRAEHTPVAAPASRTATNYWLEAEVDLGRLGRALGVQPAWPAGLPRLALTVSGAGGEVRTEGKLKFPKPLPYEAAAWTIPTNLLYQPLISFTAIRGFRPWLESQPVWKALGLKAAPGQVCFWAREGLPFLSYGAAPLADASNCVARITERLVNEGNAWISTNARTSFIQMEGTNGVALSVPYMTPYLQSVRVGDSDYVLGGLLRQGPGRNRPAPPELFQEITRRTNLVAYDWELTGPRLESWFHTLQQFRMLCFRDQIHPESASVKAFAEALPKLGNCATVVMLTAPDQLSFVRRSAIGLTAIELNLLADWLESPRFPRGFYSRDPYVPPVRAKGRPGTNSVPPPPGP